jgi:hypothetical protein
VSRTNPGINRRRKRIFPSVNDPAQSRLAIFAKPRAGKVARAVVMALTGAGRLGKPAKVIARESGQPLRTVYRSLHRLTEIGIVQQVPGGYALTSVLGDITTDPAATLGFQNLRFVIEKWQTEPAPPCRTARPWHPIASGDDPEAREGTELVWEGRRVNLTYYPSTGKLEVRIEAHVPIPLHLAGELMGWLKAMLGHDLGAGSRPTLIEVNAGHQAFRWEPQYLEVREMGAFAHVIYQRLEVLREEWRLFNPVDAYGAGLTVTQLATQLVEGSPQARWERIVKAELELRSKELELERLKAAGSASPVTAPERQPKPAPRDIYG